MRRRPLLLALAAGACALAPAGAARAATLTVDAGALRAEITTEPWSLRFTDRAGRQVVREAPGARLGFRSPAGRASATRVTDGAVREGRFVGTLATSDPLGRRLRVTVAPTGDGAIAVTANVVGDPAAEATGVGFATRAGERFLGFGERSNTVDQRGRSVESYVADGPYQPEERPFIAGIVPAPGFRARDDATYFPMPWVLSTAGYGVLVENDERSVHDLGAEDPAVWRLETETAALRLRVFAGPRPADVVRRLTEVVGRQPPPAQPWFFGAWYQPPGGQEEVDEQLADARRLREADAPTSVAQTYAHYLPCPEQDEQREARRTTGMRALGYAVTTYFNPMVCTNYGRVYGEARERGLLTRDPRTGQPYVYRYGADADLEDQFLVGQLDFSHPEAVGLFQRLLAEAVEDRYDGWMEDFGEYTPTDAVSHDGTPGPAMHNRYPVLYHRASERFARPRGVAGFIRSGWTGVHPHAQLVWGGDPSTDWGFDGLESALWQGLTIGTSGISRWGSDIGGFFALGRRELDPELLVRWIQLGAVSGVMRTQANGVNLPPRDRPQVGDEAIIPVWRRYARLRTQLYPYLVAADAAYRRTGLPVMRHLALVHPDDPRAVARDDAFMFGPDLLAAPVVRPGQRRRTTYVPAGRWIDLGGTLGARRSDGAVTLGRARVVRGGREVTLDAPLDRLPLLARAGAVLPLLPPDVDTLAPYGAPSVVRLADRRRRFELLAFPRGRSSAAVGERGRVTSREGRRSWSLTLRGARGTRYVVRAALSTLRRPFRPCTVHLGRRALPRRAWRYDRRLRVLRVRVRVPGRAGVLRVRGC